ncbi:uncharacterized protein LOC133914745 [Phragmites australis]|uniref:uncharacterized protein LOC133914745 n=1 Tax=Phragmites australis TaxID=29695 RepID=UPI002D791D31|nr:uncharacterized protein LOC133914745 [Phragmites australis]
MDTTSPIDSNVSLSSSSSDPSSSHDAVSALLCHTARGPPPPAVSASQIQMVNIRAHTLDLADNNYAQWRRFFDTVFGKFSLHHHVAAPGALLHDDPDWVMFDQSIVNWFYTTISNDMLKIVMQSDDDAFTVWNAIEGVFRDNRLTRAIYLEAEFRTLQQDDMTITQYCTRLKTLADQLRDVGQPVKEDNQVINMLRGLNPKYRHAISAITSHDPLPSFSRARSHLLLEEINKAQEEKQVAAQALYAGRGSASSSSAAGSDGAFATGFGRTKNGKKKGKPNQHSIGITTPQQRGPAPSPAQWQAGFNPWTGMVQAWPMPFRVPGAGLLGPRPGAPTQQAYTAHAHDASQGVPTLPSTP